jgi:hypothetical protein
MESLKLDIFTLIPEEVHHHLEVSFTCDVSRHDTKVCTIEEDLAQELEGLAFGNIVVGED